MFNYRNLERQVLRDEETMLRWCQDRNLILKSKLCEICGTEMNLRILSKGKFMWRCRQTTPNRHDLQKSALEGTWFSKSRFGMENILRLTYLFSIGITNYELLVHETSNEGATTSSKTISDWLSYCREVCFVWIDQHFQTEGLIGGPGRTVEIDEAKLWKSQYKGGEKTEGCWMLGMIESEEQDEARQAGKYRLEICPESKRDVVTLIPLIKKHVAPGTTIITDLWRAYFGLSGKGYYYLTVNHSHEVVNPQTGIHTQIIESSWRHLKQKLKSGIRHENVTDHLCEYLYRREVKLRNKDPFLHFINCIASIYPPTL